MIIRILFLIVLSVLLSGCLTIQGSRTISISYDHASIDGSVLSALERDLESSYVVSRDKDLLTASTPSYSSKSKGIFGWFGPVWEERITFTLKNIIWQEEQVLVGLLGNKTIEEVQGVGIETLVYERQNTSFEWQEKREEAIGNYMIHDFYSIVRGLIRSYEHRESKGNTGI